jgi:hypothetical protein
MPSTCPRACTYLVSDLLLLSALGSLLYCIFSAICLLIIRLRKRISLSQPTSKAFEGRTTGAIARIFAGYVVADGCKVVVNLHGAVVDSRWRMSVRWNFTIGIEGLWVREGSLGIFHSHRTHGTDATFEYI